MPDTFADALNHFRASVKPLSDREQHIVNLTESQFQQVFGDAAPVTIKRVPIATGNPLVPFMPVRVVTLDELEQMFNRGSRA